MNIQAYIYIYRWFLLIVSNNCIITTCITQDLFLFNNLQRQGCDIIYSIIFFIGADSLFSSFLCVVGLNKASINILSHVSLSIDAFIIMEKIPRNSIA